MSLAGLVDGTVYLLDSRLGELDVHGYAEGRFPALNQAFDASFVEREGLERFTAVFHEC